ncbi:unnamed protein product [Prorocentrum cordatum]|uniref:Fe2OG dioxygenase domain-containing protein n=1 Tax=Prorocentrum cordatum TaxID=2364126 RepID=A0ABN9UW06_9DINO|nr:unnamed protein product [Polarella glacialis]
MRTTGCLDKRRRRQHRRSVVCGAAAAAILWQLRVQEGDALALLHGRRGTVTARRCGVEPAERYPAFNFAEEVQVEVGTWSGVEQSGSFRKVGKAGICRVYRLARVLDTPEVGEVLRHVKRSERYTTDADSVDSRPSFEYYPFQNGRWQDEGLREILHCFVEDRLMPYVRERYACDTCALADILVRRYVPGERRTHRVHFDGHAFATAVLGVSDPADYEGGLFVQPGPDVASAASLQIDPGDLVVHSFDLQHGVRVLGGERYSVVFWIKDTSRSVADGTVPWHEKLAEQGDADALFNLATHYEHGTYGKQQDPLRAIELYERSATLGHHFAQNNVAIMYRSAHMSNPDLISGALGRSAMWFEKAAEAGFALAQKNYAEAFAGGLGVEMNMTRAVAWMRRAAEQHDLEAEFVMGESCRLGRGVELDMMEAVRWYQASAEAGFPKAQYALGVLFCAGTSGVARDMEMGGVRWRTGCNVQAHRATLRQNTIWPPSSCSVMRLTEQFPCGRTLPRLESRLRSVGWACATSSVFVWCRVRERLESGFRNPLLKATSKQHYRCKSSSLRCDVASDIRRARFPLI